MLRAVAVVALVALSASTATAQPPIVERTLERFERGRELLNTLELIKAVAYALRDPAAVKHELARIYGVFLYDPVLGPLVRNTVGLYRGGVVRMDANAALTADLAVPASMTASVEASWDLPLCRVVGAAASGQLGYDEGDALAAYTWRAGGCLPLPGNTIEASYTRSDNVRTSLLDRPLVFTDRRVVDRIDGQLRFYRWRSDKHHIDIMPFTVVIEHTRSADGPLLGAWASVIEAAPVQWRRRGKGLAGRDQVFEFMQLRAWDLRDDGSPRFSQAVRLSPLTVDGIRLSDSMTVGMDLGVALGIGGDDDGPRDVTTPIDERGLHAEVNVKSAVGPASAELRATHTFLPLFDGQVARENRIAGQIQRADDVYTLRGEAFVARNTVLRDAPGGRSVIVGGAASDLAYALHANVILVGRIELANALVAGRATDPVTTQRELRATIGLNAHAGRRW